MRPYALAAAMALASSPMAEAQERPPNRIEVARPEAHASFGGHGDVGVGVRLGLPLLRVGFLEAPIDELALQLGFDVQFVDLTNGEQDEDEVLLMPQASFEWSFYPGPRISWFTELGFAVAIADDDHFYHEDTLDRDVHTDILFGGGLRVHSDERLAFVARVAWPVGVQLGLAF